MILITKTSDQTRRRCVCVCMCIFSSYEGQQGTVNGTIPGAFVQGCTGLWTVGCLLAASPPQDLRPRQPWTTALQFLFFCIITCSHEKFGLVDQN